MSGQNRGVRLLLWMALVLAGASGLGLKPNGDEEVPGEAADGSLQGKIVVIALETEDLTDGRRFRAFRELVRQADQEEAAALVFDLNIKAGYNAEEGGQLMDVLPGIGVPTYTFVQPSALGAGALLALGTDEIFMSPAGIIGGAAPETKRDSEGKIDEIDAAQAVSVLKAQARSMARAHGHRPEVAQAFIDRKFEIDLDLENGSAAEGEVLTLTADEAVQNVGGEPLLARAIVENVDQLIEKAGLSGETLTTTPTQWESRENRRAVAATPDGDDEQEVAGDEETTEVPFWKTPEKDFEGKILVMEVGMNDLMSSARFQFMKRVLEKAKHDKPAALILDMNTPGGAAWHTAELMMTSLQDTNFPTYTFVNPNAVSAGALIAVATDHIYMYPASNIGSALVVTGTGADLSENMQQKVDQMMISTVRNVAELKGHNPDVAEAFVNKEKEVVIDGVTISEAGTVLNLNANEATERYNGKPLLAEGIVRTVDELIEEEGIEGEVLEIQPSPMESFAQWVQIFSFLLIALGVGGAYMELNAPGFGLPGIVSILAFTLFFFGNYFAGNLAGYETAVVFVIGIALVVVELLVLPGTMIFGLTGALLIIGSLGMALVNRFDFEALREGSEWAPGLGEVITFPLIQLSLGLVLTMVLMAALMRYLPEMKPFQKFSLQSAVPSGASITEDDVDSGQSSLMGASGVATTDIRPSGQARIGDRLRDVTTHSEYIPKGGQIRVIAVQGTKVVVTAA